MVQQLVLQLINQELLDDQDNLLQDEVINQCQWLLLEVKMVKMKIEKDLLIQVLVQELPMILMSLFSWFHCLRRLNFKQFQRLTMQKVYGELE